MRVKGLTFVSDQDRISPYNVITTSAKKLMQIKKNINQAIII